MSRLTDTVLMVAPTSFGYNPETALTNSFQTNTGSVPKEEIQRIALQEFNEFIRKLNAHGIRVIQFSDIENSESPDSIFPNNWFSTHRTGELVTYPMATANRRLERRSEIITSLKNEFHYHTIELEDFESNNPPTFLEGTGSLVLDRVNKIAYAALSDRTQEAPLRKFCESLSYDALPFVAYGRHGEAIYHTNVLMCVADDFVAIGMENIAEEDREAVVQRIHASGKQLISLNEFQVNHCFAGNMLQLQNGEGQKILVLSHAAYASLDPYQKELLEHYNDILLPISIPTIEMIGGGSVRCMMAEIFKPD